MATTATKSRRILSIIAVVVLLIAGAGAYIKKRFVGGDVIKPGIRQDEPAALAIWPWPKSVIDQPHAGVTHWVDFSSPDGTAVDLFEFDFTKNPRLRFGLFDQDQDDTKPWDNKAEYWTRGVGQFVRQRNAAGPGRVVLATNGLFFGYLSKPYGPGALAHHVSPVVVDGQVHHFGSNHRWAFGVRNRGTRPEFKVFHLADRATLAREFDFGGGSAQCLLLNGKPLKLQPFPPVGSKPMKQPVPSTPQEAGHVPIFDHMRTCRVSLGWTKDSSRLYVLFVKEPDSETGSAVAFKRGLPVAGGWTVADVQRFWLALAKEKKVSTAINSDAGDLAQMAHLRRDGKYVLVTPRWANAGYDRRVFGPDFKDAPGGGALMYFYVTDTSVR